MKKSMLAGYTLIFITIIIWGIDNVLFKTVLDDLSTMGLTFIRFLTVSIAMTPVILLSRKKEINKNKIYKKQVITMGILLATYYPLLIYALSISKATIIEFTNSGVGGIIVALILASFIPKERKIFKNKYVIAALIIAFIGTMLTSNVIGNEVAIDIGVFLVLIASVFWGFYLMTYEKINTKIPVAHILRDSSVIALIITTTLLLLSGELEGLLNVSPNILAKASLISLLVDATSVFTFYQAVRIVSGIKVNIMTQICPLIAFTVAYIFLGERITSMQLIGCTMLLMAAALIVVKDFTNKKKKEETKTKRS